MASDPRPAVSLRTRRPAWSKWPPFTISRPASSRPDWTAFGRRGSTSPSIRRAVYDQPTAGRGLSPMRTGGLALLAGHATASSSTPPAPPPRDNSPVSKASSAAPQHEPKRPSASPKSTNGNAERSSRDGNCSRSQGIRSVRPRSRRRNGSNGGSPIFFGPRSPPRRTICRFAEVLT